MTIQTITLELPESLYQSARHIAQATKRPLADIFKESLTHTLPPLDDIPPEEVEILARMSGLDDASLWQETHVVLAPDRQVELKDLLDRQSAGKLAEGDDAHLQTLMDEYGRLMVRKSHAWLLLARRGYKVPAQ